MAIPLNLPRPPNPDKPPPRRRSVMGKVARGAGWLASGPLDWAGVRRIRRSATFIGDLATLLRHGPSRDDRFRIEEDGAFDRAATASLYGLSIEEFDQRLLARRRQTARIAYASFALACAFFLAWLWQALSSPWTTARLVSTVEFLPFSGLFLLIAFYNALLNFQIRVGRTASWREYLGTSLPFLPS